MPGHPGKLQKQEKLQDLADIFRCASLLAPSTDNIGIEYSVT